MHVLTCERCGGAGWTACDEYPGGIDCPCDVDVDEEPTAEPE